MDLPSAEPIRLRQRFKSFVVDGEGLFLVSDDDYHIFEGQVFVDLFPFLSDGLHETAIVDVLESKHPRAVVHYALGMLAESRVVTSAPPHPSASAGAFWDELDLDSQTVSRRLAATTVAVTGVGVVETMPMVEALTSLGIAAYDVREPTDESLHVVITDDYLAPEIQTLAAINLNHRRPWLLASGAGTELWIGPVFTQDSGCYECLRWRLETNRSLEAYLGRRTGRHVSATRAVAQIASIRLLVANLVALEVSKWAAGYSDLPPRVKTMNLRSLQTMDHVLQRRPQCRACGNPHLQTDMMILPVAIDDLERPVWTCLDDILPFVSKITGIVTRLFPAATGMASLHSYLGLFGFGRGAPNLQAFKNSVLSQAAGVGTTPEGAKAGAICEALERYSGMYHGDEPALQASYVQLDPAVRIHPNACMLYSDRQYESRDEINARGAVFDVVPLRFDETAVLDWTGVWSLSEKRFKLLPSAYLFFGYPEPAAGPMCWADSNGCASGKTLTDAIRRGLFELVERDSIAIWWYNRLRRPRVDLGSFKYDYFDRFVESYAELEREAWVLDITSDFCIPSFVAISRSTRPGPEDILVSFGAHLDACAAIEHALSEMNHLLPAVLPENRTSNGDYPYPEISQKTWWRTATIESEQYLLPDPKTRALGFEHYGPTIDCSEAAQATVVCNRLYEHGLEVLVLNQTRPDVKVPVAKVIVPGMRHFWARLAPGRLYHVPLTLGWLDRPRSEHELNPTAMFL